MSKWNSAEWEALCSGEACPICLQGVPQGIVMALEVTYLTSKEMAPMRGYCCLVLQRHAVELYELSEQESSALMRDMQRAALAIQQITSAVKMNYQIHGNTIPHLHVHLFPRYPNDPFEGGPDRSAKDSVFSLCFRRSIRSFYSSASGQTSDALVKTAGLVYFTYPVLAFITYQWP